MSATLTLNVNQIKTLIEQCNPDEKIEIIRYLERETTASRLRKLLATLKTDELAMDDITREVEYVRQKRYEKNN